VKGQRAEPIKYLQANLVPTLEVIAKNSGRANVRKGQKSLHEKLLIPPYKERV
jgi:hypothetical protein